MTLELWGKNSRMPLACACPTKISRDSELVQQKPWSVMISAVWIFPGSREKAHRENPETESGAVCSCPLLPSPLWASRRGRRDTLAGRRALTMRRAARRGAQEYCLLHSPDPVASANARPAKRRLPTKSSDCEISLLANLQRRSDGHRARAKTLGEQKRTPIIQAGNEFRAPLCSLWLNPAVYTSFWLNRAV